MMMDVCVCVGGGGGNNNLNNQPEDDDDVSDGPRWNGVVALLF